MQDTIVIGERAWALGDYLSVLWRRKWIVMQGLILLPVIAVVVAMSRPAVYRASADVLLTKTSLGSALLGVTDPTAFEDPTRVAETQATLARIPDVAVRAARLAKIRGIDASYVLANGAVRAGVNNDLLRFSITSGNPDVATRLATAYARAFIDYSSALDSSSLKGAQNDLLLRMKELKKTGQSGTPLYSNLSDKAQQLRTLELLQTPDQLVRPATTAGQIAPTPVRNGILGLFGGIIFGIGAALLVEMFDRRIRSEDEIERKLGLPLLARLPPPPRSTRDGNKPVMVADPRSIYAEPFRRLRTNIEFVNADVRAKTILVTSSVSGEGKSTTVANLAVAAARGGRRVVLVDLDLRRPTLHESFNVAQQPGATNVALGQSSLDETLRRVWFPTDTRPSARMNGHGGGELSLEFLPSGTLPPNPGEFLGTTGVAQLLAQLRERADFVFVDAPPLLAVGDTLPLSGHVDAMVIVTRFGLVSRPMLADLMRELQTLPTPKLGFVLTGVDGSGYEYGYGYGYGHGDDTQRGLAVADDESTAQRPSARGYRR